MTAALLMSALGALTLSSIIAFAAVEAEPSGQLAQARQAKRISAAGEEQTRAAVRGRVER